MNYLTPKQQKWKAVSPCITDFTYENNIDWPVATVKWGPVIQECKQYIRQKIYFSYRTDGIYDDSTNTWKNMPCQLIVSTVDIPQPGYSLNSQVSFIYQQQQFFKNPSMKVRSMMIHPGDANVLKCNQSKRLISTKNDSNNVFVWDANKWDTKTSKSQVTMRDGSHGAQPELTLTGHTQSNLSVALDWQGESKVASGGKDQKILIWDIADYQTRLSTNSVYTNKRELSNISGTDNIRLDKRVTLSGHNAEVLDISFNHSNSDLLVSCCQERKVICWDQRTESGKAWILDDVHKDDIHSIHWSPYDDNYIATGASDGTVNLIDIRKPEPQLIRNSNRTVLSLQFGPDRNHITIGSDELYSIDIHTKEITFCYYGHKGNVNDFDINERSPWTYVSTCLEPNPEFSGGGQLHVCRLLDLIYTPIEESIQRSK